MLGIGYTVGMLLIYKTTGSPVNTGDTISGQTYSGLVSGKVVSWTEPNTPEEDGTVLLQGRECPLFVSLFGLTFIGTHKRIPKPQYKLGPGALIGLTRLQELAILTIGREAGYHCVGMGDWARLLQTTCQEYGDAIGSLKDIQKQYNLKTNRALKLRLQHTLSAIFHLEHNGTNTDIGASYPELLKDGVIVPI